MKEIKSILRDIIEIYRNIHTWTMYKFYSVIISSLLGTVVSIPIMAMIYLTSKNSINLTDLSIFQSGVFTIELLLTIALFLTYIATILFAFFLNIKFTVGIIDDTNENNYYHYKLLAMIPLMGLAYYFQDKYTWFIMVLTVSAMIIFSGDLIKEIKRFWKFFKVLSLLMFPFIGMISITFILSTLIENITNSQILFTTMVIFGVIWALYFLIRSIFGLFYLASDFNDSLSENSTYYLKKSLSEVNAATVLKYILYSILFLTPFILVVLGLMFTSIAFPELETIIRLIGVLILTGYISNFHVAFYNNIILKHNI